jgi:hypothetical protein
MKTVRTLIAHRPFTPRNRVQRELALNWFVTLGCVVMLDKDQSDGQSIVLSSVELKPGYLYFWEVSVAPPGLGRLSPDLQPFCSLAPLSCRW